MLLEVLEETGGVVGEHPGKRAGRVLGQVIPEVAVVDVQDDRTRTEPGDLKQFPRIPPEAAEPTDSTGAGGQREMHCRDAVSLGPNHPPCPRPEPVPRPEGD